jgi:glycosyltransferase involved in cell wall biosynthesis
MSGPIGSVGLISADPWDEVWRRNQHLAVQLMRLELASSLVFVNPPSKLRHVPAFEPVLGIHVVTPHLVAPRHRGGLALAAWELRAWHLRSVDVVWINDPVIGARYLRPGMRAVYDVTDDWRTAKITDADRAALIAAEDRLASAAATVACSSVLRERWIDRYGVTPVVVQNGVDTAAYRGAKPFELSGPTPHLMYVGTLHDDRLDVDLVAELARELAGSVHLVGPDHLSDAARRRLTSTAGVVLHGSAPSADVPRWLASANILLCPHVVTEFTLSLDAIKSFEYLASGKPVVATPTSGFQELSGVDGFVIADRTSFAGAVAHAIESSRPVKRSVD